MGVDCVTRVHFTGGGVMTSSALTGAECLETGTGSPCAGGGGGGECYRGGWSES